MKRNSAKLIVSILVGLTAIALIWHLQSSAQDRENHGVALTGAIPYAGSVDDAMAASAGGQTIPMSTYSFTASKDGEKFTDVIVGGNPFSSHPATTTIKFLIVPVIVEIGSTTFDPTVDDSCITGATITPLVAFQQSPLLRKVIFDGGGGRGHAAEMNGVNLGTTTYPDAFRRAEFWSKVQGTNYHVAFNVTTTSPWTISASEVQQLGGGNVLTTGCALLGVLNTINFQNYIQNTVIPGIPAITPTTFALFLMKDVVTTTSPSLNCINGCEIGYHSAFGSPVQTFSVAEYDSTADFWDSPGIKNISIDAHEIGEWLDDPLVTNPTPFWGNIGQVSGCQGNWEVGDPLTGTDFPSITMPNGVTYDPQELAFWSWYYNAEHSPSIGAGGKFSDNGSFTGPSRACPPGGTY